jgi:hypothetical protein
MLKRKFTGFECVFCLGDEEFAYVDANQYNLCETFQSTNENVAICLKDHNQIPNNRFTHIPLGCKLENPDKFIEFLETKTCTQNTDFVEMKSVLNYLGCSTKIMNQLEQQSRMALDENSIVSAFYAFETVQSRMKKTVKFFDVSLDRIEFFMAYGHGNLTLTKQVSPPQNIPYEILNEVNDEIVLNGLCVFPNLKFVESCFSSIVLLNSCNQYSNCQKICQLLLNLHFVIVVQSLVEWKCFPPFDKISIWNPIRITVVKYNDVSSFYNNMKTYDYLFYYLNASTLITTIDLEHFLKTGLNCEYNNNTNAMKNQLLGIPIPKDIEEFTNVELEEARFDVLMQSKFSCANFNHLLLLENVDKMPLPKHYLAEDEEEFCDNVEYDEETQILTCVYPFPIRVSEELETMHGKYRLVTIYSSEDYDNLCKSLSELTSFNIVSTAAFVDHIPETNDWIHCNITGTFENILIWETMLDK